MKHIAKIIGAALLALVMVFSSLIIVSAETTDTENDTTVVSIQDDGGSKAYQLVWKYKTENGHLYRRRWNKTLGQWYDPAWILVY